MTPPAGELETMAASKAIQVIIREASPASPDNGGPAATFGLPGGRLNIEPENVAKGLGKLVLTLVKLLHELLERQGIRRMEAGALTEAEIERLGITLKRQAQEIDRLRREFGLEEEDLNIDLGPLGQLL